MNYLRWLPVFDADRVSAELQEEIMFTTYKQLELDFLPEGVTVTVGTLADWEEANNVSTNQEANYAVQRHEGPRPSEGV